jgi:hypothetical protein
MYKRLDDSRPSDLAAWKMRCKEVDDMAGELTMFWRMHLTQEQVSVVSLGIAW